MSEQVYYQSSSGKGWHRAEVLMLARQHCQFCRGLGVTENDFICNCVYQRAFSECYRRFQKVQLDQSCGRTTCDFMGTYYARNSENFLSDFWIVGRKNLEDVDQQVFRWNVVRGFDDHVCCKVLKLTQVDLRNSVNRIEQRLGRVFHELEPYPLHPTRNYFSERQIFQPVLIGSNRTGVKRVQ